jgi:hypothetical protein
MCIYLDIMWVIIQENVILLGRIHLTWAVTQLFDPFSQFSLEVHNPKTKVVFTALKSAQGNGTNKQKRKAGKINLWIYKTIRKTDLNIQMYKEKHEYETKQTIK